MRKSFLFIWLVFAAGLYGWHRLEGRPSSIDETKHMRIALEYRDWVLHGKPIEVSWAHVYPPLYHWTVIPFFLVGTVGEAQASLAHLFWLAIFLFGVGWLQKLLRRSEEEMVLLVLLTLSYGVLQWATRRAMIDFPLMAWVTLSVAALLAARRFTHRGFSLFWGVCAGAGMLIKPPYLFFMTGPVLWAIFSKPADSAPRFKNMVLALALASVIGLSWYFWQSGYFLEKAIGLIQERTGEGTDPRQWSGLLYYVRITWMQMGALPCLFTAIGCLLGVWSWRKEGPSAVMASWFVSGFFFLTMLVNKDPRHSIPLLPVVAGFAARGWFSLCEHSAMRKVLLGVGGALCLYNGLAYDPPRREDWAYQALSQDIVRWHQPDEPFLSVSVLSHSPRFFARGLRWDMNARGIGVETISSGSADASFPEFLIVREGDHGTETHLLSRSWQRLLPESDGFRKIYRVRSRYRLPDDAHAVLYQRLPVRWDASIGKSKVETNLQKAMTAWIKGGVRVSLQASLEELAQGRLAAVRIEGERVEIRSLPVARFSCVIEKPWINLDAVVHHQRAGLLALQALTPSLEIRAEDLQAALTRVKGLKDPRVQMNAGVLTVHARYQRVPLEAQARIFVEKQMLVARLDRLRVAGIPLPGWIIGKAHCQRLPLTPTAAFPASIRVRSVYLNDGKLIMGS